MRVPPVWNSTNWQKKVEPRHSVAFMKFLLGEGFTLNDKTEDYKDQVLNTGRRVEDAVLKLLKALRVQMNGSGSVLHALRPLHKSGVFHMRTTAHKRLLHIGSVDDTAPVDTQGILAGVGRMQ
ncbi:hypothetical protein PC129_g1594 [Phytophthora cactorum]|uniref:Uncharacterized protein n=1 Tax=Phytophthora cactorum TaxID=29920 RepID=A0A329SSP4_9STRA|nr:hypothetical protein PC114_g3106 [Phytophthora cactorum]KAG2952349.1 hypothetical protein PC117_g2878 [Phytophthora cactorum]KAG2977559.1 hypothetical protein PC120_g25480 [Phytophthora cactorum]KAG3039067.1 hypothetical protein PC119_g2433 [Phytophthora cactorum]KAG3044731.1 hypothetical protein PC121_g21732 [Phytophthora cactorum]